MRVSLRLSGDVVSEGNSRRTVTLTEEPFWIGRDAGPDGWTLSENENVLSRKHCTLMLMNGEVVLTDHSTHGTAVGTMNSKLVVGQPTRLNETSTIYLAEKARIDVWFGSATAPMSEKKDTVWDQDPPAVAAPPPAFPPGGASPGGPPSSPSGGLQPPGAASPPLTPPSAPGLRPPSAPPSLKAPGPIAAPGQIRAPGSPNPSIPSPGAAPSTVVPEAEPHDMTEDRPPVGMPVADREPSPAAPAAPAAATGGQGPEDALNILATAMGIDVQMLRGDDPEAALREIGESYRAMADSLRTLLGARRDMKIALGIQATVVERDTNPLKSAGSASDAVACLTGERGATDIVNDAHRDLQAHQASIVGAVRAALSVSLEAFDPKTLREKMEERSLLNRMPGMRKAALWDAFENNYRQFKDDANDDIRRVLKSELDKLYNASQPRN